MAHGFHEYESDNLSDLINIDVIHCTVLYFIVSINTDILQQIILYWICFNVHVL
jgi:energy-converting hydrogenase Eha subunit G